MEPAASVDAFLAAPHRRYLVGSGWIYFCAHPELFGIVFYGRPGREDLRALTHALLVELRPGILPHRSLVDGSRLAGVDAGAFEVLHHYVREHHAALSERVTGLALVRPGGIEGAVVAGFYQVLDPPYPVTVSDRIEDALTNLGEGSALAEELAELAQRASGDPVTVTALRAFLSANPSGVTAADGARALAISERTLQRRLQEAGTTFQREQLAARLERSRKRMLDTDDSLTAIALDVGFATLQHFSAAFREATGISPSEWRRSRRNR